MSALLLVVFSVLHSRLLLSYHWAACSYAKCAWQLVWLYVKYFGLGNGYETCGSQNQNIRKDKFAQSNATEKYFFKF